MNIRYRAYLQYLFFIGLAVFFVWLSLRHVTAENWKLLKSVLREARYWIFFPVLFILLLSHWVRGLRWKMLIDPLKYHPSSLNCFFSVMIGYLVNLGAPRLGEIIKCTVLARYEKIPADKLIGTIVAERAFDLISLLLVFGLTFVVEFNTIGSFALDTVRPLYTGKAGQFSALRLGLVFGVLILGGIALWVLFTRFLHINFVHKLKTLFRGILHGLTSIRFVKNKFLFLLYTAVIWTLYLMGTWMGFQVLRETSGLGLGSTFAVLSMGSIGMILAPGGIGAYPLLIQQTLLLYGVAEIPYGQAVGWLSWIAQFLIFVLFGALSFILLPIYNKKKDAQP